MHGWEKCTVLSSWGNVVLQQFLDCNMKYRRVTAFLKRFMDHKSDSLLLLVCICVVLWETKATYTVGKAEFSLLLAQRPGTNVTSALERDKWMIHPKMNNGVQSEDKWVNQTHKHWAIWLKQLYKFQTNECITILICIGLLEINAWRKITKNIFWSFTWLACISAEHNVYVKI